MTGRANKKAKYPESYECLPLKGKEQDAVTPAHYYVARPGCLRKVVGYDRKAKAFETEDLPSVGEGRANRYALEEGGLYLLTTPLGDRRFLHHLFGETDAVSETQAGRILGVKVK